MKDTMNRRDFIEKSAKAAAAVGVCGPLLKGCSAKKEYDLIIKEGLVYDGTGREPFEADIGVVRDSIAAIGKIRSDRGRALLSGKSLAVSPGFIDVHDHSDIGLIVNPKAESVIHQGITTLVSGNCGGSPFPVAAETFEEDRENIKSVYGIDLTWKDMAGFFSRLEAGGIALNYATLVGHGSIRGEAMGFADRPPTPQELSRMIGLLEEHIRGGAFGLSTGLEYTPGSFAQPDEIVELCRAAARLGGLYATHMRDEGDRLLESLDESINTARLSGARLQISHLKAAYPRNWSKLGDALARIERAQSEGIDIYCDRYPYIAASTGLSFYFPMWAKEGTTQDFVDRLKDPALDARLRAYLDDQEKTIGSWEKILLSSINSEKNRHFQGKNILEAAAESGKQPFDFMRDLLIEERAQIEMIAFIMNEDNLKKVLAHPLVGIGCDGSAVAPYGILGLGKPHPRNYGTFPRVLGKYVREEKILPAEEMIKKMTSIPAARFGFAKRGLIQEGHLADIVIFDPDAIEDRATWVDPHQYPAGIAYVIVNGQVAVDHNEHTGRLAGRILRKAV
jgi:N-acyl-D-amino-acid deacylase